MHRVGQSAVMIAAMRWLVEDSLRGKGAHKMMNAVPSAMPVLFACFLRKNFPCVCAADGTAFICLLATAPGQPTLIIKSAAILGGQPVAMTRRYLNDARGAASWGRSSAWGVANRAGYALMLRPLYQ